MFFGAAFLQADLARAASRKTVLDGGVKNKDVVISPQIEKMLAAYLFASRGRVIVVCTPSGTGKTTAAEFLMHGKHPYRPDRSLKISAASLRDFPVEYAEKGLGVKKAGYFLGGILCRALKTAEPSRGHAATVTVTVTELVAKAGTFVDKLLCKQQVSVPFAESAAISIYGRDSISNSQPGVTFPRFPMLIIDNFDEDTKENTAFVQKLLQEAADIGVFVFILTTKQGWATKLVGLNGGAKIRPLHGNVDNTDYELCRSFTGVPDWNTMPWTVETLRALIQPLCEKNGIDPVEIVPDGALMSPTVAKDEVASSIAFLATATEEKLAFKSC
jgi:hypothetical protein